MSSSDLVGVCGLYCGACGIYRASQDQNQEKLVEFAHGMSEKTGIAFTVEDILCDGCLTHGRLDLWCKNCRIRLCEKLDSETIRCSDCDEYPCTKVTDFRDDGMTHHSEITDNLEQLKKMGIDAWAEHEEKRWTCPECQSALSWYDAACSKCHAPRSKLLFQL